MTNEEKAKEIANNSIVGYGPKYFDVAEEAALEMAKYKDQQFRKVLEKKKEELFNNDILNVKMNFINEIINIL